MSDFDSGRAVRAFHFKRHTATGRNDSVPSVKENDFTYGGIRMRPPQQIITALIFLMVSAGPTLAQSGGKATDVLQAADAAWLQTYEAKDLDKAVAFCDEQGSLLWPNAPIATGRNAITKLTASAFAIPDFKLVWHADKAGVAHSGDLGYTSGTYLWTFKDPSGKSISDKGKYLTVWKKQGDGSWKVLFDTFNTDLPQS